jgi:hypothetical protein
LFDCSARSPGFGENAMVTWEKCPDCGAALDQPHNKGCDVERCSSCGQQRISCHCENWDWPHDKWTGDWPIGRQRIVVVQSGSATYVRRFVVEAPVTFDRDVLSTREIDALALRASAEWEEFEGVTSDWFAFLDERPLSEDPVVEIETTSQQNQK